MFWHLIGLYSSISYWWLHYSCCNILIGRFYLKMYYYRVQVTSLSYLLKRSHAFFDLLPQYKLLKSTTFIFLSAWWNLEYHLINNNNTYNKTTLSLQFLSSIISPVLFLTHSISSSWSWYPIFLSNVLQISL